MSAAAQPVNTAAALEAVLARIKEISTLPHIALAVIDVAKRPDAGAADLKAVVEGDPALSARVVRMVNSAAFGVRTTVTNLHQAISFLGFNQVRNLAMTASVSEIFKKDAEIGAYKRSGLWRHMVSVGIGSRLVARRLGLHAFEDAFLAGLLHDIGIILIDQHLHDDFEQLMHRVTHGSVLTELEREILGFDHCQLGERVAEEWRFPVATRAAIRWHHQSLRYNGEGADLVRCVEVANVICSVKGITSIGRNCVAPPLATFQAIGLTRNDIVVLAADFGRELAQSEGLFEL